MRIATRSTAFIEEPVEVEGMIPHPDRLSIESENMPLKKGDVCAKLHTPATDIKASNVFDEHEPPKQLPLPFPAIGVSCESSTGI
jgi:hypothetical protein